MQSTSGQLPLVRRNRTSENFGDIQNKNRKQTEPDPTAVAILRQILQRLTAREREALDLYYNCGWSQHETCEALGMGIGALRELKERVRAHFAAAISMPVPASFAELIAATKPKLRARAAGA